MISKELLGDVLDIKYIYKYYYIDLINQNNITIEYYDNLGIMSQDINIYELAHKCKEWALKQGYYLRAEQGINYYDKLQWTCFLNKDMNDGADYVDYWNLTEVEAIIKAGEWLYREINK